MISLHRNRESGFTLIETLVAISLLTVAIVAPMSLVAQSLSAAYYARDEVTAYNLAQEGIEAVRAIRDGNVLADALQAQGVSLLYGIPVIAGTTFTIDTTQSDPNLAIETCAGACPALQTDGTLYGYAAGDRSNPARDPHWTNTDFTRTMTAVYVGKSDINSGQDAIRVSATVSWLTPNQGVRSFTIYENMYRWINDGAAQ